MCGICGVVSIEGRPDGDLAALVQPMMAAMWHRGPDASGHLVHPGLAMGMRRLSIIDRATGSQPFWNEDRTVAVIFNGEIYNFEQLRQELTSLGHHFRSRSDTEAIVHAFEQWDDECLTRLRGMFALAIYDGPRHRLLLARDRLGIKPLYYTRVNGRLLFASEVRALLASGAVPREVSREGLESFLLFGSVSEPATLVEGVRSLLPGHALNVPIGAPPRTCGNGDGCEPRAYWTLSVTPPVTSPVTSAEGAQGARHAGTSNGVPAAAFSPGSGSAPVSGPARELRALLEDSIRLHLISDEPLGVFLSGGVDSTAIAALASRARAGVRCYTIAFREREFDESEVARRTAKRLGVEHEELLVEPRDMLDGLDAALGALDQPSVDGINTYCVSAAVRRAGAKVALSGLGGDELFGGYRTFRWMPALGRLSAVARHAPRAMRSAGAHAIGRAGAWMRRPEETDRLASLWREPEALPHPFFFARTVFGPGDVRELVRGHANGGRARGSMRGSAPGEQPDAGVFAPADDAWRRWNDDTVRAAHGAERFTAVSYFELRSYMLNTLLRDADAMSMAHSIELRVPLLDHPIVEFVAGQPDAVKQRHGAYKPMLVDALGDLIPPEVSEAPKRGFTFPWQEWMRGPLAPRISARLHDLAPALDRRLDREAVVATWTGFQAGRYGWLRPWSLYVLDEWVRRHL
jgi:asparagine synthase (glutamine-hydrolysing)